MSDAPKKTEATADDSDATGITTDALGRRIWDKEEFAKRAKERTAAEEALDDPARKRILAVKRDDLRAREKDVNLSATLGKSRVIASARDAGGGFYCKTCDCVLKDSINYLDHVNGKKHQRNLGMSMRVERSTLDQVKARLAAKKREREQTKAGPATYDLDSRVAALQEEENERARKKRERVKKKRRELQDAKAKAEDQKAAEAGLGPDSDVAALMGFGGFGGSKK
eukprot:m.174181 g.174181  ORF g.174181 m.174181 type:complete len:226 (+) comp18325_c0_seq1:273-950(+)